MLLDKMTQQKQKLEQLQKEKETLQKQKELEFEHLGTTSCNYLVSEKMNTLVRLFAKYNKIEAEVFGREVDEMLTRQGVKMEATDAQVEVEEEKTNEVKEETPK